MSLASVFSLVMMLFFFINLNSFSSDYTAGGVTATVQFFYNFLSDRPFQTSLYAIDQGLGFHNPYAYLNTYAIHVNVMPFLFAPIWNLWPNLTWLNGMVFLVNYASMAFFAWKTLQFLSPGSYKIKALAAIGLAFSSGFLFTFQQNAQFLLFATPFMLAAYYFLVTRQKPMFMVSMLLLCLISEDAAMVALTFSSYIFLFERDARKFAYWGGAISITYLAIALFIVQPAARAELELTSSTTALVVINHILTFKPDFGVILIGLAPALFFLPAFFIAVIMFGNPQLPWIRIEGLVLLAPLPHWGESVVVGASHHLIPVLCFLYAGFVTVIGKTPDSATATQEFSKQKALLVLGLTALFLAGTLRILISNVPENLLPPVYDLVGKHEKARKIEQGIEYRLLNRRVVEAVRQIPKGNSLTFLTNSAVAGYIADRSDIWPFPYYFDVVDYLVLQPGVSQSFYSFPQMDNQDLKASVGQGKFSSANDLTISPDSVRAIVRHLVENEKTHRIALEEPGLVLLERIEKKPLYIPPSTLGFGWIHNVGMRTGGKGLPGKGTME